MDMAGYQKSKDRGTFQSDMLDVLEAADDELAEHIRTVREWVEQQGGMLLNDFLNINRGLGGAKQLPDEGTTRRQQSSGVGPR